MAILNLSELIHQATEQGYQLPAIHVQSLSVLKGVVAWAKQYDVPFLVTVDGAQVENGLILSIEEVLKQEAVASAIVARRISNHNQAIKAIRYGCQGLFLNTACNEQDVIANTAKDCGILSASDTSLASDFLIIDEAVELSALLQQAASLATWQEFDTMISDAVVSVLSKMIEQINAQGMAAKANCKKYAPVEHLIIYNSSADEAQTKQAIETGIEVLDNIAGVRATWSGEAVTENAKYRWCWLIRFTNESVISSYRDNPNHVAYADEYFRPIAGDRISIDYALKLQ
jgi:hypothetical protein